MKYVNIAEKLNADQPVDLDTEIPEPFSDAEMEIVKKLLYGRRSIRSSPTDRSRTG
jgi:hypothetical protein